MAQRGVGGDPANQPGFPYAFVADLRVTFTPEYLQVELTITNADRRPFSFEEALHTYLSVSDVRQVSIDGLDGVGCLDRAAGAPQLNCVQDGPVRITAETDRLHLGHPAVMLNDPGWGRTLRITNEGAANLVVWNPWVAKATAMPDFGDKEWNEMICIEAANALNNAITLAPGEAHLIRQRISLAWRAPELPRDLAPHCQTDEPVGIGQPDSGKLRRRERLAGLPGGALSGDTSTCTLRQVTPSSVNAT